MNGIFTYGDIDLTPYVTVTGVSRSIGPGRRITRTEVPGIDGVLARVGGLEPVEMTVTGYVTSSDIDGVSVARHLMARMLLEGSPRRLRLPDEPWLYYMATYEGGAEPSRHAHRPKVEFPFLCADPVAYGQHRAASLSDTTTISAGGTYPSWPVVTVKPPSGTYWQITNVDTGDYVRVDASFTGSQTLVIDMGLQRCTINGTDHAADIASDFFRLDGVCHVEVSGGTATMEWDERWL